jgi:pilus assembly protein CpaB
MRPIAIIIIVFALIIAGLTAVLMNRFLTTQVAQPVPPPPKVIETAIEDVLVAAVDIAQGTVLKADDLRYAPWPVSSDNSRLIRRGSGDDPKAGFVGTILRRPLVAGEPLAADSVFRQDEAGVLAGLLSPGMRAISVPVTSTSGVNGFVLPNDRVDVLLDMDVRASQQNSEQSYNGGDIIRFATEVLISNVRVLAVDNALARPDSGASLSAKTVTLEVSPKDAEVLLTGAKMGELSLVLCSLAPGEAGDVAITGFTGDLQISRALQSFVRASPGVGDASAPAPGSVRINRRGVTSVERFAN